MQVMGFGQYITSGFDQYEGHSAIGIGESSGETPYGTRYYRGVGIGKISSLAFGFQDARYTINGTLYYGTGSTTGYTGPLVGAIVF